MSVLIMLIYFFLTPTIQELIHCFIIVGACIGVSKIYVDYGISLEFPQAPN